MYVQHFDVHCESSRRRADAGGPDVKRERLSEVPEDDSAEISPQVMVTIRCRSEGADFPVRVATVGPKAGVVCLYPPLGPAQPQSRVQELPCPRQIASIKGVEELPGSLGDRHLRFHLVAVRLGHVVRFRLHAFIMACYIDGRMVAMVSTGNRGGGRRSKGDRQVVSSRLPRRLAERLAERAKDEGMTVSDLIARFIDEGLDAMDEGKKAPFKKVRPHTVSDGSFSEQAFHELQAYKLLGDAFEDELRQRERMLDDPLRLVRDRAEKLRQAVRELGAALELARHQGVPEAELIAIEES